MSWYLESWHYCAIAQAWTLRLCSVLIQRSIARRGLGGSSFLGQVPFIMCSGFLKFVYSYKPLFTGSLSSNSSGTTSLCCPCVVGRGNAFAGVRILVWIRVKSFLWWHASIVDISLDVLSRFHSFFLKMIVMLEKNDLSYVSAKYTLVWRVFGVWFFPFTAGVFM